MVNVSIKSRFAAGLLMYGTHPALYVEVVFAAEQSHDVCCQNGKENAKTNRRPVQTESHECDGRQSPSPLIAKI